MMENELKEKVLIEMFTIKAGVSIIADENDKIERVKAQIEENEKTLQNNKYTAESLKKSIEYTQKNIKEHQKGSTEILAKVGLRLGALAIALVLAVIGFFVGVSLMATDIDFETEKGMIGVVLMAVCAIVIIVAPPFVLLSKNRTKLSSISYYKQKLDVANDSYKDYTKRLKELEAHTQLTTSEASYLQTKLRCQINESTPIVQGTYKFLLDNCKNYITELDFQNVDLLIYYIYRGMADTVKEALQETEKALRHEEIKELIKQESSAIRRTIEDGFIMLNTTINYNFSQLGTQLAKQHNEAMEKISSVGSSISSKLSDIEAGQRLQNSLSASINKSSIESGKSLRKIEEHIRLYGKR